MMMIMMNYIGFAICARDTSVMKVIRLGWIADRFVFLTESLVKPNRRGVNYIISCTALFETDMSLDASVFGLKSLRSIS